MTLGRLCISLERPVIAQVKARAALADRSVSSIIRRAIADALAVQHSEAA
jgi:Ribbon-helix-helix protein, copG family